MTVAHAVAYCRQSEGRRNETAETSLSLESQESYIRKYADENGLVIKSVHKDHDLKGDNPNRPALRKALNDLEPGDTLVVYDSSRLARDNILQETVYRDIVGRGCSFASVTEPNIQDDLLRGFMGVINQYFRVQLGRKIASNVETKVRQGRVHSRPPFGYNKVGDTLVPNEWAPVVKEIFERIIAREPYNTIAKDMHSRYEGHKHNRWDHKNISRMVNIWTYSGAVRWHDEIIWNDEGGPWFTPIISREMQERAVAVAAERQGKHTFREKDYSSPLEGLVEHECGASAYLRYHGRNYDLKYYAVFACSSQNRVGACRIGRKSVSDRKLELLAVEALQSDLGAIPGVAEDVLHLAEENYDAQLPDTNKTRRELMTRKTELVARNERAIQVHMDGLRDRAWMHAETGRIAKEIDDIDREMEHLPKALDVTLVKELAAIVAPHKRQLTFLSIEQAAALIRVLGVVCFGPTGVTIKYRDPYSYLVPRPTIIPLTSANPHLYKRDPAQKTFGPKGESPESKVRRRSSGG